METLSISFVVSAFVAGLLMFLAPCTLPLIPGYIAFISGTNKKQEKDIIKNSIAFVLGFTFIFVLFGILAGLLGSYIAQFKGLISQVGGIIVIFFGLFMLNVIKVPYLSSMHTLHIPSIVQPGHTSAAFLIGAIFATGWTPCIGPILASILLLASATHSYFAGGFMLLIFSLGLAIPFVLTAVFYKKASVLFKKSSSFTKWINEIGGFFLIGIGILLLTNNFELLVMYGNQFYQNMGLGRLFDLY